MLIPPPPVKTIIPHNTSLPLYFQGVVNSENEQIIQKLSTLEAEVRYLQERDRQLNGTIFRVDQKVDGLKMWLMGVMAGVIASIFVSLVNLGR